MNKFAKLGLLVLGLIAALGSGEAIAFEFGSKVVAGDTDEGKIIYDFPSPLNPIIGYWDVGINPGTYDMEDPLYLDMDADQIVDANDLRLCDGPAGPGGSKVKPSDNDINAPLRARWFGAFYSERDGMPGYSAGDAVYLTFGPKTVANDVRLNKVDGLNPGSKVLDLQADFNAPVASLMSFPVHPWTGPVATLRFYNSNGNLDEAGTPIYDYPDTVYLDVSLPSPPVYSFVAVNDIRLSV